VAIVAREIFGRLATFALYTTAVLLVGVVIGLAIAPPAATLRGMLAPQTSRVLRQGF
jgi:hypothetical protein